MSWSATSTRFFNTSRDGDSTTSLGSLFQCLTTLSVKKFFWRSNLNLPWCNSTPCPLFLSPVTWKKLHCSSPVSHGRHHALLPFLVPRTWQWGVDKWERAKPPPASSPSPAGFLSGGCVPVYRPHGIPSGAVLVLSGQSSCGFKSVHLLEVLLMPSRWPRAS